MKRTVSGVHTASRVPWALSLGVWDVNLSTDLSNSEGNAWLFTYSLPYACRAWGLVKHRYNSYVYFTAVLEITEVKTGLCVKVDYNSLSNWELLWHNSSNVLS
jgi:hypothetical protein